MRILMLNSEYPPLGGGQGNANKAILDSLSHSHPEVEVDLITASIDQFSLLKSGNHQITFLDIGKKNTNYHFQSVKELLFFSWRCFFYAKKQMKQKKYDLIIAWSGIPAGYLAMRLSDHFQIPYIVLLRGADVPFYDKRWKILDTFFLQYLSPLVWKKSASTIANSKGLRDLAYRTSRKKKIDLLYNGIDQTIYHPAFEKKRNIAQICCAGRLNPVKGFDLIIRAVANLSRPCHLKIAGDGPQKERLNALIKELGVEDRVTLLGRKGKEELIALYQESSLFCLPSHQEGMSNALLEAMACGLPVVSTNVGGAEELVDGNGIIVPCGAPKALQDALEALLFDEKKLLAYGKRSLEIAKEFSWDSIANQMLTLWKKIIEEETVSSLHKPLG